MTLLQQLWAYITLGAMAFLWEEASPLIGGVAAYDRNLRLVPVLLAVALGTWTAGLLLYALGRWQGHHLRKRWPKLRPLVLRSVALVRRHPWRTALAVRFAFGLRIPLPIACGVARLPLWLYLIATGVSSVVWSTTFTVTGWYLGQATEQLIGQVRRFVPLMGTGLVLLMILVTVVFRRRHLVEKTVKVLDREPKHAALSAPAEQP